MKYVDEFRDPDKAKLLISEIKTTTDRLEIIEKRVT